MAVIGPRRYWLVEQRALDAVAVTLKQYEGQWNAPADALMEAVEHGCQSAQQGALIALKGLFDNTIRLVRMPVFPGQWPGSVAPARR